MHSIIATDWKARVLDSVGFVGLGKLGLPCAAALSVVGKKKIFGFDINPNVRTYVEECKVPYEESRVEEFLSKADINIMDSIVDVVGKSEIVFVAVQTPHEEQFEGTTPVPDVTRDFDYTFLKSAIEEIASGLRIHKDKKLMVVVISTVLPGTMREHVLPILEEFKDRVEFCYNPFFIAMGTTIPDYLDPEFLLIGSESTSSAQKLAGFYAEFLKSPSRPMKIESAELAKVAYNTFIGFKIVFANTLAEITSSRGGDVDEITSALAGANMRLMSAKYLSAGMADGGGCHPRDQIAMSWLSKDANLSTDIFGWLARARDAQTMRQAELIKSYVVQTGLPVTILGKAYKANINLTVGSPALLLSNFLYKIGITHVFYDPYTDPELELSKNPQIFFVATNHFDFKNLQLPTGSICIDPWGNAITAHSGVKFVHPGRESLGV